MTRLIPVLAILIGVAACKKDGSSKPSLIGTWVEFEFYNGSAAGCNCWTTVNELHAEKIEFKRNGTFQRTPPMYSSVAYCLGEYRVVNDSTLTWGMSCTTTPVESTDWFSKQGNILTIAYQGPGFYYKRKYKKE